MSLAALVGSPLTAHDVIAMFDLCVVEPYAPASIEVEGIETTVWFGQELIEAAKPELKLMLEDLPDEFHSQATKGGWSFLNMCMDRYDEQWADTHATVEKLMLLGIAAGYVSYLLTREAWPVLPGGLPYVVVDTSV